MEHSCKSSLFTLISILFLIRIADAQPKYPFQIPVYPGTVESHTEQSDFQHIQFPFIITLKVYRTPDGSPLNADTVISFYESYLKARGWGGTYQQKPFDSYLAMGVRIYETRDDHAMIHLAGHFYLWVSPRDGMLTIYTWRWRYQQISQPTTNFLFKLSKALDSVAAEFKYNVTKVHYTSGWLKHYENEYLLECTSTAIGPFYCTILTYIDSTVAYAESERLKKERNNNILIQFNRTLLLLSDHSPDHSRTQKEQLSDFFSRLQRKLK